VDAVAVAQVPFRVLIVDDDEDMRFLSASYIRLANDGLEIIGSASNGEDGLELWREEGPDAIVLDHRMPGRDGLDIASEILGEDPDQSVILFSAYLDLATIEAATAMGVRSCLSKDRFRELPDVLRACRPA
jgi:DNA-binding NarL/FixJ family response regulator